MRQIIIRKPYDVVIEEVEDPPLEDHQFKLRALVSAVSAGTERMCYNGTNPAFASGRLTFPRKSGYAMVGEVVETGKQVEHVKTGDRVFAPGRHASDVVVDRERYYVLPDGFSTEAALFTTLTTTAVHCAHRSNIKLGDTVGVVGLGVLGILMSQVAKAAGASKVIGIDLVDRHLEVAGRLGVDVVVNPKKDDPLSVVKEHTGGFGVDIAIEASGFAPAFNTALDIVRKAGTVTVLGWHTQPLQNVVWGETLSVKELTVVGTLATGPPDVSPEYVRWSKNANFREAAALITQKTVDGTPLITHRFKAEDIKAVYELIDKKTEDYLQIVLVWD